jgi:hypothetical protein
MSPIVPVMRVEVRPQGLRRWDEILGEGRRVANLVRSQGFPEDEVRWMENSRWFNRGALRVCVNREPSFEDSRLSWHLSISTRTRYPTWDEIKGARYDLVPNEIWMVQVLPPKEHFVNHHENTFHLWQSWEAAERAERGQV